MEPAERTVSVPRSREADVPEATTKRSEHEANEATPLRFASFRFVSFSLSPCVLEINRARNAHTTHTRKQMCPFLPSPSLSLSLSPPLSPLSLPPFPPPRVCHVVVFRQMHVLQPRVLEPYPRLDRSRLFRSRLSFESSLGLILRPRLKRRPPFSRVFEQRSLRPKVRRVYLFSELRRRVLRAYRLSLRLFRTWYLSLRA